MGAEEWCDVKANGPWQNAADGWLLVLGFHEFFVFVFILANTKLYFFFGSIRFWAESNTKARGSSIFDPFDFCQKKKEEEEEEEERRKISASNCISTSNRIILTFVFKSADGDKAGNIKLAMYIKNDVQPKRNNDPLVFHHYIFVTLYLVNEKEIIEQVPATLFLVSAS